MEIYNSANTAAALSIQKWDDSEVLSSVRYNLKSRFLYICSAVANISVLPFALLATLFSGIHALCVCDRNLPGFQYSYKCTVTYSNHFFMSLVGAIFTPTIAHKYRDFNLTPYIIAARIAVITGAVLYYALLRK